jgi:hypothetical protein
MVLARFTFALVFTFFLHLPFLVGKRMVLVTVSES